MPSPAPGDLDGHILSLLPTDGTPVLNRVMRVMLTRERQRLVSQDEYFAARDRLFDAGRIGLRRGQGGQIYLAPAVIETTLTVPGAAEHAGRAAPAAFDAPSEKSLMAPLGAYLRGSFARGIDVGEGCTLVQDISTSGPARGKWTRPDYLFVSAMRFKLLPGIQVDVHAFELKTETGGSVYAVHEALAQTRFTHFGHLVWHLPGGSKAEARLPEIEAQCDEHGIGLIRMFDPIRPEEFEILLDPRRKATPPAIVDGFLETRLNAQNRERLVQAVRAGPA